MINWKWSLFWVLTADIWFFAVYSNALQESANSILYNGLIEELVDVLQITDKQLVVRKYFISDRSIITLNTYALLGLYM